MRGTCRFFPTLFLLVLFLFLLFFVIFITQQNWINLEDDVKELLYLAKRTFVCELSLLMDYIVIVTLTQRETTQILCY